MRLKKMLWISLSILLSYFTYGQTPPGVYPSVLENGCVNSTYLDIVNIVFIADTAVPVPPFGTFTINIDSVQTTGFSNVPAGLTATCLSPACTAYPPGTWLSSSENIVISGTPTSPVTNNVITIYHTIWYTALGAPFGLLDSSQVAISIGSHSYNVDTITECDSLVWIDGNTYYESTDTATYIYYGGPTNTCDSIIRLFLTIIDLDLSVTQVGTLLTANETEATYQWLDCNGMTVINGATNPSFTPAADGDYAVIINKNACIDTSACYTVSAIGITQNSFGKQNLLYPNPTDGNFSIDLGKKYRLVKVTIADLNGRLIKLSTYNESQILNLNIKEPAGIYLLKVESGDKKEFIRVVME